MPNFEQYVARHGEYGVQALIERIERNEGICTNVYVPLEERWNVLMQMPPAQAHQQRMAA